MSRGSLYTWKAKRWEGSKLGQQQSYEAKPIPDGKEQNPAPLSAPAEELRPPRHPCRPWL